VTNCGSRRLINYGMELLFYDFPGTSSTAVVGYTHMYCRSRETLALVKLIKLKDTKYSLHVFFKKLIMTARNKKKSNFIILHKNKIYTTI
jgi:hypothetical protein